MLNYAYRNVSYYHKLFDSINLKPSDIKSLDDLSKIPITTKQQLRDAKIDIIAQNIDLNNCVNHKTSGSTGIPLELIFTKEDGMYSGASYERVRRDNGYNPLKDIFLNVGAFNNISHEKKGKYPQIRRFLSQYITGNRSNLNVFDSLNTQVERLEKINPNVIWGYPSAIEILARAVEEKNITEISPRLIFTASEILTDKTRNYISSVFNCELFDVYGSWETGCMAWECNEHAGYHMNMDTLFLEFLDENGDNVSSGERGKVVVTNLNAFAMPRIRYEVGDFAIPTEEECSCGRGGYLMKTIEGRCDDFIKLPNNKMLSPSILWAAIRDNTSRVSAFQIIQEKEDTFTVNIVKVDNVNDEAVFNEINCILDKILGEDVYIKPKIVDIIEKEKSGKLRSVISKV
jgi:phenylacetate-CoA ligase